MENPLLLITALQWLGIECISFMQVSVSMLDQANFTTSFN